MLPVLIRQLAAAGRAAKPLLPRSVARWLKRIYHHRLLPLTYRTAEDGSALLMKHGIGDVPPPALRHRVHGEPSLESFLNGGRQMAEAIRIGMAQADMSHAARALDFGCGCGRTLLWLTGQKEFGELVGTDIDAEAIDWVATHLHIQAAPNAPMPPLAHTDGAFDLIYSISVFTHLDEVFQDAWFREFQRLLKPGGVLLVTCHSEAANALLPSNDQARVKQQGLLFYRDGVLGHVFPEFYQNTYHSPEYIQSHWGAFFEIVGSVPFGVQDLIVMRQRRAAATAQP